MDIVCRKRECGHNNCTCCEAKGIEIGDKLDCKTFTIDKQKKHKNLLTGKTNMFEVSEELSKYKSNKSTKISCNAKECLFNDDCNCTSNGISVINRASKKLECACKDNNLKAENFSCSCCSTFIKK